MKNSDKKFTVLNSLNKEINRLALPSIVANITVPLVGMVDIAIAGHIGNASEMTATMIGGITIGGMMFDLLYWNCGFLRAGTGGLTAQAYGRGAWGEGLGFLLKGLMFASIIALLLILLQWPFSKFFLSFVKSSEEVTSIALKYFLIRIWASPATLSLMAFKGWFIGMQDSMSAMFSDCIVNGVNIVASAALAMGLPVWGYEGIGFSGIAIGTVIAQYCGLAYVIMVFLIKYRKRDGLRISMDKITFKKGELGRFLSLNSDLFIRSVCLIAVYLGFTLIAAKFGDLLLAVSAIMMKLFMLFAYFTDGFAFAGEALVGKYIGMKDKAMAKKAVNGVLLWSMGVGLFFIVLYLFGGGPILRLMTNDLTVIEACRKYFLWLLLMPAIGSAAFTFDGLYIGATASKELVNASLSAVAAFFLVWFCLSPFSDDAYFSLHLLMTAYFSHLAARTLYQALRYKTAILGKPFSS